MQGSFHSILFLRRRDGDGVDEREEPPYVADLNLDQVLEAAWQEAKRRLGQL